MGNNVCFTPGARTFWHTHEKGQILTVTLGSGLICSKGEEPKYVQPRFRFVDIILRRVFADVVILRLMAGSYK
jgi:hypothetical protein